MHRERTFLLRVEQNRDFPQLNSHLICSLAEGVDYSILDAKKPEDLTEEEKIALLGRPCLGNNPKLQIRIRESREFKVYKKCFNFQMYLLKKTFQSSVDRMMAKSSNSILAGSSSWLEQFTGAFEVQAGKEKTGNTHL